MILIRHGETVWNREQRIQGQRDAPLNALGRAQAAVTARYVVASGLLEGATEIHSSDLSRALDTARAIVAVTGLPLVMNASLRERHFGELEGVTYAEWRAADAESLQRFRASDPDYGPPGGETGREFLLRCVAAIEQVVETSAAPVVAMVTHGGVVSSLYRHSEALGHAGERTWSVPNASVSVWRVDWRDGKPTFACQCIGNATHLEPLDAEALESIER
ncbi:MAG: histidine phosphatase family protein [Casimicrobiaceae bacterium]